LISIDEKTPIDSELVVADDDDERPPTISPHSSVISLPSTRLTDLTSLRTGDTMHTVVRGSLERSSLGGSRPPSYYSYARSPSPTSSAAGADGERDSVWQHPVMASDWLEVLRQDALRGTVRRGVNRGQNGSSPSTIGPG